MPVGVPFTKRVVVSAYITRGASGKNSFYVGKYRKTEKSLNIILDSRQGEESGQKMWTGEISDTAVGKSKNES